MAHIWKTSSYFVPLLYICLLCDEVLLPWNFRSHGSPNFKNHFFLISFRVLSANITKIIEKCPFTYWLNGRWFLQIVDRDSGDLYPIYIYPLLLCYDFCISNVWVFWGGGGNVFLAFYAICNCWDISRKNNYEIKKEIFTSIIFWKYWKVPLHLLVKWEVVYQIVDIGNFSMKLNGRCFSQIGIVGVYIQYIYIYINKQKWGVSFWTCWREISGNRVAVFILKIKRFFYHIMIASTFDIHVL